MEQKVDTAHPAEILIRTVFISIGCGLLLVCMWLIAGNVHVLTTYERAPANVVSSRRIGPAHSKSSIYELQVRYCGPRAPVTASTDPTAAAFDAGESVAVYYRPERPFHVVVNSFRSIWFAPALVGLIGLFLLLLRMRSPRTDRPVDA